MIIFERDLLNDLALDYLSRYIGRSTGLNGFIIIKSRSILLANELKRLTVTLPIVIIYINMLSSMSRSDNKVINIMVILDTSSAMKLLKIFNHSLNTDHYLDILLSSLRELGKIFLNAIISALMTTKRVKVLHTSLKTLITDDDEILRVLLRSKVRSKYVDKYKLEFCSENGESIIKFTILLY